MDAVLLQRLSQITEEERELLQGRGVDRALYASGRAFEVDAAKMLEKGKLMSIRPHTRFAPFPRHSHNYVEIMYMCRGKTVHRIDGDALVTLEAGELLFLNRHASHAIQRADAGDIAVNFIVLPQFFDRRGCRQLSAFSGAGGAAGAESCGEYGVDVGEPPAGCPAYQSGDDGAFAAAADALYGMH